MNDHAKIRLSLLFIIMFVFCFYGCSQYSGPSDKEVKKIIEESIIANNSMLRSHIEILDKGKSKQKDSWFFIVRTSYRHSVYGDTTRESIYFIRKTKDKSGNPVLKITDARDLKIDNK
jgi:hypothetical protein